MCSSFIDVGVRGEREVNFKPEPGVSAYDPNEVVARVSTHGWLNAPLEYGAVRDVTFDDADDWPPAPSLCY